MNSQNITPSITPENLTLQPENYCRFCNSRTAQIFTSLILEKYEIKYFECFNCKSLQTEQPFWLSESYSENLSTIDTGAAQRLLRNLTSSFFVGKLFGLQNLIDIGGGDGLLCRFLRDYGFNCYSQDKFARAIYAQGYTQPNFTKPDLILAFEVFEHFENPREELNLIFNKNASVYLISTVLYKNNGKDWWYLAKESGQHVFFYSKEAIEILAKKYDYNSYINGNLIILIKHSIDTKIKSLIIKFVLNKWILGLLRAVVVLLPCKEVQIDLEDQKGRRI